MVYNCIASFAAPCAAVKAETVSAAQKADGTLRVWLQSLGAVKALGLTLAGSYTVEGDRGFRFEPGTEIKLGADGALFYANGRPPVRVPAPPVERVIDGTGAGDAFVAGFLPAWLDKKPPAEALGSGCRLAAHALNLIGARPVL